MQPADNREYTPGLVSVIIPAYKHEAYVGQAIGSAIAQSYGDIELIVVDDGSPDGTWEVIQSMEEECRRRFKRVDFSRQENQGICGALNVLLSKARGEYFLRLDSDDALKPWSVEKMLGFLAGNPEYGLAVGNNELIDDQGRVVFWNRRRQNVTDESEAVFKTFGEALKTANPEVDFNDESFGRYDTLIWANYIPNGYLVRRALMKDVIFTKAAPREDYFMMLQLAKKTKFKYFDEIMHSYRWHGTNNVKKIDEDVRYVVMTKKHEMELLKKLPDYDQYRGEMNALIRRKIRSRFKLGNFLEVYKVPGLTLDKKLYVLRLGSLHLPLVELYRGEGEKAGRWKPKFPAAVSTYYF